jgi:WhiB family redox-sensing transcriptional regulator
MSTQLLEFNLISPLADSPTAEGAASTWMARGACAQSNPNVFFPHDGVGVEIAKAICADCRATSPCLEYALANRIEHGVWGGCSERQRRRILRDRRAAARSTGLVAVAA